MPVLPNWHSAGMPLRSAAPHALKAPRIKGLFQAARSTHHPDMRPNTSRPCCFQKCRKSMKIQFSVSLSPSRR